ncbi:MAG TPA: DUF883 family protein [Duganella sp.]|nr:DUF883 family protein [Duganella sp.]
MDQTHQSGNGISDGQAASGAARDKLMDGLKTAIGEAEHYLSDAGAQVGGTVSEVRARFEDTLRTAKSDLRKLEDSVIARSHEAAQSADAYVRDNPWKAVCVGGAVGVLIGILASRR